MAHKETATIFIKICSGISLVLCSLSILFFSLNYNAVKAGTQIPQPRNTSAEDNYVPVGIEVKNNRVYLYGYDETKSFASEKLVVLTSRTIAH